MILLRLFVDKIATNWDGVQKEWKKQGSSQKQYWVLCKLWSRSLKYRISIAYRRNKRLKPLI
jgi:hypothetical protein